jgi:adenine deaminase
MMSDLEEFDAELVIHGGRIVARDGQYCLPVAPQAIAAENTVRIGPVTEADLQLETTGRACPVIRVIPGQIVTERVVRDVPCVDGHWVFLPGEDLALATCIERHAASGKIGLGLIEGFGLQSDGAFGSSVAHDSHNLIVLGTNPRDMLTCVRHLEASGGGFVVATEGRVLADLPLPVAGLMSTEDATAVRGQLERLHRAAEQLGCGLASPFAALSFLALPVIPELRVTPRGLFDVGKQQFVDMSAIAVR